MKLLISGNVEVNRSYVQTLCMLFFPGAKFAENEEAGPDTPVVEIIANKNNGSVYVSAQITVGDKRERGEYGVDADAASLSVGALPPRALKIAVGAAVFNAGKAFFGSTPPWGILTGVRPSKLAAELLNDGLDAFGIKSALTSEYFVNPKKASLAAEVAINEAVIIKKTPANACSLYISIPFCPTRCNYCSFVSYATPRLLSLIPAYVECLKDDLRRMTGVIDAAGLSVSTVYIGGGTPTILSESQLDGLLAAVESCVDTRSLDEYTLEAGRPDTVTAEKLETASSRGVTRISVNPQTLSDEVLQNIGRRHTVEDFYRAFEIARQSKIKNVNVDLIAGLPGDTYHSFSKTVDKILQLRPENVTFHTFCVKKSADVLRNDTDIFAYLNRAAGEFTDGDTGKCVDYAQLKARNAGYHPYYMYRQKNTVGNFENVGFSIPGCEGLYNIYIMEEIHSIFAVGAGAVTKLVSKTGKRIEREAMPKYPYEYISMREKPEKINAHFGAISDFFGLCGNNTKEQVKTI